jgi:hypothetical protein
MTFRDDLDATLARIDVLEREIRGLIDENVRLRRKPSPHVLPPRRLRVTTNLEAAGAHVDVLSREKARLIDENAKLRAGAEPPPYEPSPRPWPLNDDVSIDPKTEERFRVVIGIIVGILFMLLAAATHK